MAKRKTSKKSTRRRTQMRKSTTTKRRKRARTTSSKTNAFSRALANFMCPHKDVAPTVYPDEHMHDSLQMVLETTGILQPHTHDATDSDPDGANALVFFPGAIFRSHHVIPTQDASTGQITGFPVNGWRSSNQYDTILADIESFRCVGATLKLEYIGNNDQNGGEIIVKRFDPIDSAVANVPQTPDEECKKTSYFRAREGCFLTLGKSDNTVYNAFHPPDSQNPTIPALEGVVIFLQGCDADVQSWRWRFTQSVELRPEKNTFLARLAHLSPPHIPVFSHTHTALQTHLSQTNLDSVTANQEMGARDAIQKISKAISASTAKQTGMNIPSTHGLEHVPGSGGRPPSQDDLNGRPYPPQTEAMVQIFTDLDKPRKQVEQREREHLQAIGEDLIVGAAIDTGVGMAAPFVMEKLGVNAIFDGIAAAGKRQEALMDMPWRTTAEDLPFTPLEEKDFLPRTAPTKAEPKVRPWNSFDDVYADVGDDFVDVDLGFGFEGEELKADLPMTLESDFRFNTPPSKIKITLPKKKPQAKPSGHRYPTRSKTSRTRSGGTYKPFG